MIITISVASANTQKNIFYLDFSEMSPVLIVPLDNQNYYAFSTNPLSLVSLHIETSACENPVV